MSPHNFDFGNTLSAAMRGERTHSDLAAQSFAEFVPYVLKSEDDGKKIITQDFQLEVIDALESKAEIVLIIIPRGFGKSQLVTAGYAAYQIGLNRNIRSIVASSTKDQSVRLLRGVEAILNDPDYHEVFGDYVPHNVKKAKWTEDTKHILRTIESRDPTLYGVGVGGAVVGRRADLIMADDIIDPDSAKSSAERESAWDWFNGALRHCRVPKTGRIIVVNTRYSPDDVAGRLLKQYAHTDESEFRVVDIPALIGDPEGVEHSIWESRFPTKWLQREREINYFSFQAHFMNDPVDLSKSQLPENWLNYEKSEERTLNLENGQWEFFAGIDPNTAREDIKKDYFSMAFVGVNQVTRKVVLVDLLYTRANLSELIQMFKAKIQKWKPSKIMLESNAAQVLYKTIFNQESEYLDYPFELVFSTLKKEERIVGMAMNFMNGRVSVASTVDADGHYHIAPQLEAFRREWIMFPYGDTHFDALDSVDLALRPLLSYVNEISLSVINNTEFERRMLDEQTNRLERINSSKAKGFFDEQLRLSKDFYASGGLGESTVTLSDAELDAIEDAYLDGFKPIHNLSGRIS